jgi:hypothetical protein
MGWVVNATPWPLYTLERAGTNYIGGWMGRRADLGRYGKPLPNRYSIPDRPARSESLYRLRL